MVVIKKKKHRVRHRRPAIKNIFGVKKGEIILSILISGLWNSLYKCNITLKHITKVSSFKAIDNCRIVYELSQLLSFDLDVLSPKGEIIWTLLISALRNMRSLISEL